MEGSEAAQPGFQTTKTNCYCQGKLLLGDDSKQATKHYKLIFTFCSGLNSS